MIGGILIGHDRKLWVRHYSLSNTGPVASFSILIIVPVSSFPNGLLRRPNVWKQES